MDTIWELLLSYHGRITVGRFWFGMLLVVGLNLAFILVLLVLMAGDTHRQLSTAIAVPMSVNSIATTYIQFAISVKRCHDRGKSGWLVLLIFVPLIGVLWAIIDLGILKGEPGPNEYGPDPRGRWSAAEVFE